MLLLSSDVQMRRVLTSIGNVMGRMTARMVLTNRIVVIYIAEHLIISILIHLILFFIML